MLWGIRGTYVYACDEALREYLKQHIPTFRKVQPLRFLSPEEASENRRAGRAVCRYLCSRRYVQRATAPPGYAMGRATV